METIQWKVSDSPVSYPAALKCMERRVQSVIAGTKKELVWLLEHPHVNTKGTSAESGELLYTPTAPVYATGRGGRYTYHGPGQRIIYLMMDLRTRGTDIRQYVHNLESWIISTLAEFDIQGERKSDRIGIWVSQSDRMEVKLGAIGIRVRRWVTFHGVSLNIYPDLKMYDPIIPCGVKEYGVSSMQELGVSAEMRQVDEALFRYFGKIFGGTENIYEGHGDAESPHDLSSINSGHHL